MVDYPCIHYKPGHDAREFYAEGKTRETVFRIGISFDAAACAPVRHETIKDALLARAQSIMSEAESAPTYDWEGQGFRRAEGECWTLDYSVENVADLL